MRGIRKPISKDSDVMVDAPTKKTLFEDCDWRKFMRYVKSVIGRDSSGKRNRGAEALSLSRDKDTSSKSWEGMGQAGRDFDCLSLS